MTDQIIGFDPVTGEETISTPTQPAPPEPPAPQVIPNDNVFSRPANGNWPAGTPAYITPHNVAAAASAGSPATAHVGAIAITDGIDSHETQLQAAGPVTLPAWPASWADIPDGAAVYLGLDGGLAAYSQMQPGQCVVHLGVKSGNTLLLQIQPPMVVKA